MTRQIVTGIVAVLVTIVGSHAVAAIWTGDGNANNDGDWSNAANWDSPPGSTDDVVLPGVDGQGDSATNVRTVTVDVDATVNGLTLEDSSDPFSSALQVDQQLTINGPFSAGARSAFAGAGHVVVQEDASPGESPNFTGLWEINGGTTTVGYSQELRNAEVRVNAGATYRQGYRHLQSTADFGSTVYLNGGTLDPGTLGFWSKRMTSDTPIVLEDESEIYVDFRDETNGELITLTSDMTGAGGFNKTGPSWLRLTGQSTYDGPTVVESGTLEVQGVLYDSHVTVEDGATLIGGRGSFRGGVTSSGTFDPDEQWSGGNDTNNDGNWSDASNWFDDVKPGPSDVALLGQVNGQGDSGTDTRTVTVDEATEIAALKLATNTVNPYTNRLVVDEDLTITGLVHEAQNAMIAVATDATLRIHDAAFSKIELEGDGSIVSTGGVYFPEAQSVTRDAYTGTWTVEAGELNTSGRQNHLKNANVVVESGAMYNHSRMNFGQRYDVGELVTLKDGANLYFTGFSQWNGSSRDDGAGFDFPSLTDIALDSGMATWRWTPDGIYRKEGPASFFLQHTGVISGDGGINIETFATKSNGLTPTITLAAANTYTGPTAVVEGILQVTGSLANSNITIEEGGTLRGGSGTLYFNVSEFEQDLIVVEEGGEFQATDLTLSFVGTFPGSSFVIADYSAGGLLTGEFLDVTGLPDGWYVTYGDSEEPFVRAVVPEPATLMLLGLGGLAMTVRRRRA